MRKFLCINGGNKGRYIEASNDGFIWQGGVFSELNGALRTITGLPEEYREIHSFKHYIQCLTKSSKT